ncbi:hypothetical protein BDV93DRAFT_468045 [Ceratobasidium sp. AG-I]|nr:hypothetical protein BDV93DRAFT_468045 [Ceratobasidium sp. AG-I]
MLGSKSIEVYSPPELFHEVFKHIKRKACLAQCCLINKSCRSYAVPRLYEWIYVYTWHKNAKKIAQMILNTLAESPYLASHVKILDFRDFPTHLTVDEHYRLEALAVKAIEKCTNLRSCTWTRDGSLTTQIIRRLGNLKNLKELEINGRPGSWGEWVSQDLFLFSGLQSLTLIMPARAVANIVPSWVAQNAETLESLVIICKSSPLISDEALRTMAPSLRRLRRLHLTGCAKITEISVYRVISENCVGLQSLALESCSLAFDMSAFSAFCCENNSLAYLTSISLTIPLVREPSQRHKWFSDVLALLKRSPIESFQLYAGGGMDNEMSYAEIGHENIKQLVDRHRLTLRRIGIQRLITPLESLGYAAVWCPNLQDVFVTLANVNRDELAHALALGKVLHNLHLTLMTDIGGSLRSLHLSTCQDICLHVARSCTASLRLIGAQTKVWEVTRRLSGDQAIISLEGYSGPQIPEQFLMMKS